MDPLILLLIAVIVVAAIVAAFAVMRSKQRSGSVLAAPHSAASDQKDVER